LLLHALVLALLLYTGAEETLNEAQSPPAVSVVFENGGAAAPTAPPAPVKAAPTPAQAPSVPPPPPPHQN